MSTWLPERIVDISSRLSRWYYARRYGEMARWLGRPGIAGDPQRRGFIIIQIDGLSYDTLVQAVAAGHMPHVARLLAERRLVVGSWRCGLPSTTTAVQAGLLFGNRDDIPGFRWYDKEQRASVVTKRPDHMRALRARISQGRLGILRGGSCYVSVFDGDADLALFTLSSFHSQRFFESARGLGLFLLFLLSPLRVLHLLWRILCGYLRRLGRRLEASTRRNVVSLLDLITPLLSTAADVLFTEVQTFGIIMDIYRCVPSIYSNYTGYDEMAHKAGPDRSAAFEALRIIDRAIRQVNRMRVRYRRREYDLYIMSDHGNTPSVPFSWVHEGTLGDAIRAQIGEPINLVELVGAHLDSSEHARYMLDEVRGIERRLSPRLRRISASARLYVRRRLLTPGGSDYNLSRQGDIVVSANGPLAHIYFNVADWPLDLAEVLLLYPQLADALLSTPGIGVVAGRAERRTVILAPGSGVLTIGPTGRHLDGQHPLGSFGDVAYAEAQLHRLVQFPHAGDLVVLGGMLPDGRVVTFEKQLATHGSLGGTQLQAFVARPPECPLAINTLDDPEAFYTYFTARYLSDLDTGPGERLTRLCEMGTAQRFG